MSPNETVIPHGLIEFNSDGRVLVFDERHITTAVVAWNQDNESLEMVSYERICAWRWSFRGGGCE